MFFWSPNPKRLTFIHLLGKGSSCERYPDHNIQREFDVEVAFQLASCKLPINVKCPLIIKILGYVNPAGLV